MVGAESFRLPPRWERVGAGAGRYSGVRVHQEIEAKLAAAADVVLPDLGTLPGVARVEARAPMTLEAVYFDTADLRLARSRMTLRRRTGGRDAGWHLKLPVSPDSRTEFEAPLGSADDVVPPDLVSLARARIREVRLAPVAVLTTTRVAHDLYDAAGRRLAEVSDDGVTATSLDGRLVDRWREWEVELVEGDRSLLAAVVALLTAAGGVPPEWWSKLARALGQRLPAADAGAARGSISMGSAGAVLRERLRTQRDELLVRDPLVRRGEPDSVHQMRVASRRVGSALATFRALEPERSEAVRAELRWLAGLLGAARDAEVTRLRLTELAAREPADLRDDLAIGRLDEDRVAAYRAARVELLAALESTRYFRLLDALDAVVDEPGAAAPAQQSAARVLAAGVRREAQRLARSLRVARSAPAGPRRDALLHEARKAAKRTRYAAETALPVAPRRAERYARRLEELQTLLGHHHDTVALRAVLRRVGGQAHGAGEDNFSYGRWHAIEQLEAEQAEAAVPAAWKRIRAEGRRHWLH